MLPLPEARRGDDPGPGGRLKEVNSLTAQLTVPLPCATKSSGNLRFPQEIDRPQMYGFAVIVVASFGTLDTMEAQSEA